PARFAALSEIFCVTHIPVRIGASCSARTRTAAVMAKQQRQARRVLPDVRRVMRYSRNAPNRSAYQRLSREPLGRLLAANAQYYLDHEFRRSTDPGSFSVRRGIPGAVGRLRPVSDTGLRSG